MFQIDFTDRAIEDLEALRKFDQQRVLRAIEDQLSYQPDLSTRNRKRLRPNRLAEWELRVGDHRVFYDALKEQALIKVVAIGYKEGNKLYFRGEEYEL